jgi:hypothetical protein
MIPQIARELPTVSINFQPIWRKTSAAQDIKFGQYDNEFGLMQKTLHVPL